MKAFLVLSAIAILWAGAGTSARAGDRPGPDRPRDIHSFGNPLHVRVTHVRLNLAVDFHRKELRGLAELDFERQPGAPADAPLVLDTRGLGIVGVRSVTPDKARQSASFKLGPADPILGAPLTIVLPKE